MIVDSGLMIIQENVKIRHLTHQLPLKSKQNDKFKSVVEARRHVSGGNISRYSLKGKLAIHFV